MDIKDICDKIKGISEETCDFRCSIQSICDAIADFYGCSSTRIEFCGELCYSDRFSVTRNMHSHTIELQKDNLVTIELFFSSEVSDVYEESVKEGSFEIVLMLVRGYLSKVLLERARMMEQERERVLACINRVNQIIGKDVSVQETLQQVVDVLPSYWMNSDVACARVNYGEYLLTSDGFAESAWSLTEHFVTIDDKKGCLQVFYKEECPDEYQGPFLYSEVQLLSNLSKLVCGYINNYKGRELFHNKARMVSTQVNEDFRKTLTTDKQPLQLFFNKQILEKYVYLDMMKYKIKNILFVATLYDAFTLEIDDSFFEQFMGEIYQYSLFSLPRITGVTSSAEALELMESTKFDLAILMVGLDTQATIDLSANIKERQHDIPVFLLLNQKNNLKYFENLVSYTPSIDKIFVWSGNSQILFSIVKSIEDSANVENDTKIGLVRVILLVEDSPIYYSKYLQILFSIVFNQVQRLLSEGEVERNEINKISKMRQRPKILHARNYEDAMYIFEKYKDYLLCVISDVEFDHNGESDPQAGIKLVKYILQQLPMLPAILQSAEPSNRKMAEQIGVEFLNKDSDTLQTDLVEFLTSRLGFGDFIFRNHSGRPLAQAKGFNEFETIFRNIPTDLLGEYCHDNRVSSWLMSRGEIPLARKINPIRFDNYDDPEQFRKVILDMMDEYRADRRRGKILDFDDIECLDERNVISMAPGSLGGKGRGLAFINTLIQNIDTSQFDKEINIRMPVTAIVGTDEFAHFMERGNLYEYAFAADGNIPDYTELRERFAATPLSDKLMDRLKRFLGKIHRPIAVRSSSLSEDSMNQPFAGVFDTYLVPNNADTLEENVNLVATAIKMVYSSIYSEPSRTYFQTIRHNIEAEKMAVVLQVLAGDNHNGYYYPNVSGTAQSYNYYPIAHMKPEEGFAVAAVGLGYYVVGGSKAFRFSPVWPSIDTASTKDMVKNTQVDMLAVDLSKKQLDYVHDGEHAPLATLDIYDAEKHGTLKHCLSVYNPDNDSIEAGTDAYGPRIVNFANILKYNYIPLPELLSLLLNTAKDALGSPVEIEWAVDLNPDERNGLPSFYLLQMKPIITELQSSSVIVERPSDDKAILYTEQSLGNGDLQGITDIIYADPDLFDKMETEEMAKEIDALNAKMLAADQHFVLIGAGRWGTRDRFIGIPVQWSQISMAKVIVEMSLPGFPLDSSLGSHFFHNVTSMNIGYLSVQDSSDSCFINWNNIRNLEVVEETKYFKHVRAPRPLSIRMNGKKRLAAISMTSEDDGDDY
ncbi:MAG: pyruvate, phosphate dikinase [Bacteroidales bacterium]|nr:pyruvate, phosphate dikinase [Bacteroidales bacterium]